MVYVPKSDWVGNVTSNCRLLDPDTTLTPVTLIGPAGPLNPETSVSVKVVTSIGSSKLIRTLPAGSKTMPEGVVATICGPVVSGITAAAAFRRPPVTVIPCIASIGSTVNSTRSMT